MAEVETVRLGSYVPWRTERDARVVVSRQLLGELVELSRSVASGLPADLARVAVEAALNARLVLRAGSTALLRFRVYDEGLGRPDVLRVIPHVGDQVAELVVEEDAASVTTDA